MGVDVQRRIDEHVRLVDAALTRRDVPAVERRGIELALRQKILEKLAARRPPASSGGASLAGSSTSSDADAIDAVLADLPAPEAFAAAHAPLRVDRRRLSWIAVIGAAWAPMFLLMIVLSQVQIAVQLEPGQSAPMWQVVLGYVVPPLGWAAPFATTV